MPNQKPPGGWFQKILNHHDDEDQDDESEEDETRSRMSRKDRVRTMAAAMALERNVVGIILPKRNGILPSSNHCVDLFPFQHRPIRYDSSRGRRGLLANEVPSFFVTIVELSTMNWCRATFRWNNTRVLEEQALLFDKC